MNRVLINGIPQSTVSALDRGVLYGDSLFETISYANQNAFLLNEHITRLKKGVERLDFNVDFDLLTQEINDFIARINLDRAVIRVTLTRGETSRGYKPSHESLSTRILSLHDWPERAHGTALRVSLSDVSYANQPLLAGIKHGNRLEQVLAAQSIPDDADDVVMLDQKGNVISCSKGNLFVKLEGQWLTPDLTECGIEGVLRNYLIDYFSRKGLSVQVANIKQKELKSGNLEAAFMSNSVVGIVPITELLGVSISSEELCEPLKKDLVDLNVIAI